MIFDIARLLDDGCPNVHDHDEEMGTEMMTMMPQWDGSKIAQELKGAQSRADAAEKELANLRAAVGRAIMLLDRFPINSALIMSQGEMRELRRLAEGGQ